MVVGMLAGMLYAGAEVTGYEPAGYTYCVAGSLVGMGMEAAGGICVPVGIVGWIQVDVGSEASGTPTPVYVVGMLVVGMLAV